MTSKISPAILVFLAAFATHAARQPNVLVILSDDMGYSDLGCYGGIIETPNLDALAANGLRFTNFYVNNMCWPTRASLMTSLYPKTALPAKGSASGGLHPDAVTLPQSLLAAGYRTLMSGKWHLSDPAKPNGPHAPHNRGFEKFYGTIFGASDFFAPIDLQLNGKDMTREWEDNPDYYYTDAITDHALKFLKGDGAGDRKPFFLYLAFNSAHWPLHARPRDIAHYKGRFAMGWDRLREEQHERVKELGLVDPHWKLPPRHPNVPAWKKTPDKEWQQRRMEVYAAQVTCMDRNIGRIINHLRKTGVFDDTLILYHQDNGACHVEYTPKRVGSWTRPHTTDGRRLPVKPGNIPGLMPGPQATFQSYGYGWANASNSPFRLFKQFDHEGGTRSPLVVSWPSGSDHEIAGGLAHEVCHVVDIMPTLLEAAGVKPPRQKPVPMEGRSFLSVLKGAPEKLPNREALFWAHARGRAVRLGNYKLVAGTKDPWELYNLDLDGTELNNLAGKMPEKVAEMAALHEEWSLRTNLGRRKPGAPRKSSDDKPSK